MLSFRHKKQTSKNVADTTFKDSQGFMKIKILSFMSQTFSLNLNVTLRYDQNKFVICSMKQNFEKIKILKLLTMKARNHENKTGVFRTLSNI